MKTGRRNMKACLRKISLMEKERSNKNKFSKLVLDFMKLEKNRLKVFIQDKSWKVMQ